MLMNCYMFSLNTSSVTMYGGRCLELTDALSKRLLLTCNKSQLGDCGFGTGILHEVAQEKTLN